MAATARVVHGFSRRRALSLLAASVAFPPVMTGCASGGDVDSNGDGARPVRQHYGPGRSQYGELYLPPESAPASTAGSAGAPGVVVLLHGGFWRSAYDASLGAPLARDLARRGHIAWNLEYRRVGEGGGWPQTFDDVAAGIDLLAGQTMAGQTMAGHRLDLSRVVLIGHSAGGQLAVWAAGRHTLPGDAPGAKPAVRPRGVIPQAGVLELTRAQREAVGGSAVADLLGGDPGVVPERYRLADPSRRVPIGVPVACVHAEADSNVPYDQSVGYVKAARRAGDHASLHTVPGDHFSLIDTGSSAWATTVGLLAPLLGGRP